MTILRSFIMRHAVVTYLTYVWVLAAALWVVVAAVAVANGGQLTEPLQKRAA